MGVSKRKDVIALNAILIADARAAAEQQVQKPWTRRRVIKATIEETGCSRRDAVAFVNSIVYHMQKMILRGIASWRPNQQWLNTHHDVLVGVVPDHAVSQPDTAHRGIEEIAAPDGFVGVITLGHDMRGEVLDCYVHVTTQSARLN